MFSQSLLNSDALIFVVPEWDGMVPAALKNLFNLCSNLELAHKPALLVSISTGVGGSYPIAELRMSSYKNTKICYIPDHVIIRNVKTMLDSPSPIDEDDIRLRNRLLYSLELLINYTEALFGVRKKMLFKPEYRYGM